MGVCGPSHWGAHTVQDDHSIKRGHLYGGAGKEGLRGWGEREEGREGMEPMPQRPLVPATNAAAGMTHWDTFRREGQRRRRAVPGEALGGCQEGLERLQQGPTSSHARASKRVLFVDPLGGFLRAPGLLMTALEGQSHPNRVPTVSRTVQNRAPHEVLRKTQHNPTGH